MYADPTLMDLAAAYAKRRNGRKTKHAVACDRPGAKAKFARDLKVRKGTFTDSVAIVGQNGREDADYYAGLILRHKDGEEQVLWMKHGYKTEKAAERAAIQRFDAHVSRMSRPGAKAKMAAQKVARFRVGKDLSGGYSVVPMKADGSVETSVYEEIGFRHSFPTADAALAKAKQMQAKYGGTVTMEDKHVSSRPGAKAKMGLLDRLGAAASALAGPGKDPTTQEYKTSVAEAKKAAIDEVKNYAFMVKQNDQKLAALDAYVKSTSKAIATLNSAPEILRLTDGLRQAVKARSVLLQTLKMPFGRKAQFAERDLVYGPEASRIWDKLEGVWKDIDKAIRPLGRELRRLERVAKGTPLEGSVAAMIKAVEEAMTTQQLQPFKAPQEPNKGPNDVYVDKLHKYLDREEKRRAAVIALADKARALMQQVAAAKPTKAARASKKSSMARMDDATRRELRLFISRYVSNVKPADAERLMTAMYEKDPQHWEDQGFGKLAIAALGRNFSRPGAKAKSTHAALPPQTLEAERKPGGGSHSEAVSRKIATLINEGKPQDQAVAIALDLERRGEL